MFKKSILPMVLTFSFAAFAEDGEKKIDSSKELEQIKTGMTMIDKSSLDFRLSNLNVELDGKVKASDDETSLSGDIEDFDEVVDSKFGFGLTKKMVKYKDIGFQGGAIYQKLNFTHKGNDWKSDNLIFEGSATYGIAENVYLYGGLNYSIITDVDVEDGNDINIDESHYSSRLGYQTGLGFIPDQSRPNLLFTVGYVEINQEIDYGKTIDGVKLSIDGDFSYSGFVLGGNYLF